MTARQNPRQQRDWVLSQVRAYRLGGSDEVRLPQIICVNPSREWVLAQLRAEAERCFGEYDEKRLVARTTASRGGNASYDPPEGCCFERSGGAFAVVRVAP